MITLASGSAIRAAIMRNAGLAFEVERPNVDESIIKTECARDGLTLDDMALRLAESKCLAVARNTPGLVIGSDQILDFDGQAFDKPKSMTEARARFLMMAGKPHDLINGTVIARDGSIIWRNVERSTLYLRPISETELDRYLAEAGEEILASVGAYQIESLGARLFEKLEGDHFAILGLALFPLLDLLRGEGALDF